jgi:hydroxymethylbilane synthase
MRIGTRGSALALAQARHVAGRLEIGRLGEPEIVTITTSGDQARGEDKSRWVDTIELALQAGEIDLAVHSAKDVPGELAEGLSLLGAPARAAAQDALCGAPGLDAPRGGTGLDALPEGARVGTSSVRRKAQLRAAREDLRVVAIGGNVDTRLRRLCENRVRDVEAGGLGDRSRSEGGTVARELGEDRLDAIMLAHAGLQRLGREHEIGALLDPARFVPAPGQGVLALEGRAEDGRVEEAVRAITDADTFACLRAERAMASELGASCHTPLGAYATPAGCGCLLLRAWVGLPDGSEWTSDELLGGFYDPEALGRRVAERMKAAGAEKLLHRAEEMAVEHA